jgi:hypothetical protein
MKPLSSEQRKTIAAAISVGVPVRPAGVPVIIAAAG